MKSFREFIFESDDSEVENYKKGIYHPAFKDGVEFRANFPGRSPGSGAAKHEDPEHKAAFFRGVAAQEKHELEPEKDRT